jgi:hypothetical protein
MCASDDKTGSIDQIQQTILNSRGKFTLPLEVLGVFQFKLQSFKIINNPFQHIFVMI